MNRVLPDVAHSSCPHAEASRVAAAAVREGPEEAALRHHRTECGECRQAYEEAARTVAALRALPPVPGGDLTAAILARLPSRRKAQHWPWFGRGMLVRAASLALVAGGLALLLARRAGEGQGGDPATTEAPVAEGVSAAQAREEATDWLAALQRADGTWDVEALGGRPEHAPALTGLALMALQGQGDPDLVPALQRGAEALLSMQRPETGCFGGDGPFMMYNHGIATVALLRMMGEEGLSAPLREPLARAVAFIRLAQQPEGGWGYRPGEYGGPANASVSAWQLDALGLARKAGWGDAQGHLRRGLFWMAKLADPQGVVGYQKPGDVPSSWVTNTALGLYCLVQAGDGMEGVRPVAMKIARRLGRLISDPALTGEANPYRDYFAALAAAACKTSALRIPSKPDATRLQRQLAASRVASGAQRGTWSPRDAYAHVGGRLYATSLATLALRDAP